MMKVISAAASGLLFLGWQATANAQTVTGTIESTITLLSACEVNGSTATSGVDFGTLDFGGHSTFFDEATTQLQSGSANAIEIRCAQGADATLTITGGLHDAAVGGSGRAMANGSRYVPYDIYSDSGFQNPLVNGETIAVTADGSIQQIPIYGRALGNSGLIPGDYSDTISVTLDF